jgi:hypothetical protein
MLIYVGLIKQNLINRIKNNKTIVIYSLPNNPTNENDLKNTCEDLQKNVLLTILGNSDTFKANYVATFGNLVSSKNITDWVEIMNSTNLNVRKKMIIVFF